MIMNDKDFVKSNYDSTVKVDSYPIGYETEWHHFRFQFFFSVSFLFLCGHEV